MPHQIIVNITSCRSEVVCGICFAHTCFLKRIIRNIYLYLAHVEEFRSELLGKVILS